MLDVTNSAAVTWFTERLRQFSVQFGVDSFKFDAGEVGYLPPHWRTAVPLSNPNRYTTLYANMAATFGRMIEVTIFQFLPRDAMHKRGLFRRVVSVRLSVIFVYSVEMS